MGREIRFATGITEKISACGEEHTKKRKEKTKTNKQTNKQQLTLGGGVWNHGHSGQHAGGSHQQTQI